MANVIRLAEQDMEHYILFFVDRLVDNGEGFEEQGEYGVNIKVDEILLYINRTSKNFT